MVALDTELNFTSTSDIFKGDYRAKEGDLGESLKIPSPSVGVRVKNKRYSGC